tara:strand:- start:17 stop:193 length:177 start_codon:yes stop_codon:yes gene_type:complete
MPAKKREKKYTIEEVFERMSGRKSLGMALPEIWKKFKDQMKKDLKRKAKGGIVKKRKK